MDKKKLFYVLKKGSRAIKNMVPGSVRIYIKEKLLEEDVKRFADEREQPALEKFDIGINLIGSIRAKNGLGQSCRLVAEQLKNSRLKFSVYNVNFDGNLQENDQGYDSYISDTLPYGINLFHINPCELGNVFLKMPEAWNEHYNIAFWLWELEEFPDEWVKYCLLFDEIWTPSEFAGRGIREKTNITVKTMPYMVMVTADENCGRKSFDLPDDKFLYLVMYDSNSTTGRKNPQGVIEAYKKAFPVEKEDHGLVVKVNNAKEKDLYHLRRSLYGYQNVYFITEVLEKRKVNSLIRCVDVVISLHRSEGLGLVLAEAMGLGTPVIATNWSSNTEFMDAESCCMVKYDLVANKQREGLYKKGCIWAEPDVKDAAAYMVRLKTDLTFYEEKKKKGEQLFKEKFNQERLVSLWRENVLRIVGENKKD